MSAARAEAPHDERIVPLNGTGDDTLFEHAPPIGVQRRLGLVKPDDLNIRRRMLLVVLVAWLPLILLALLQSLWLRVDHVTPLLWEIGVHARYLLAAPLLVLAEAACVPHLNAIVRHFIGSGLVDERDRGRFGDAVAGTRTLLQSPLAEIVVVALAYAVVLAAITTHSLDLLPPWAISAGLTPRYSLAGWWHMLVSLPLLLSLIFGWMYRLALWARLLWLFSRLHLWLVASHPDRSAGLGFLSHSVRAFATVGMALAVIVAGRSAHVVLTGGPMPTPYLVFNAGVMLTIMALFVAPLLIFTPTLIRVWQRGEFEYGMLASRVGKEFGRKWLSHDGKVDQEALERPDFSATTDLYAIVSNVHAVRFVPIAVKDLAALAGALLLPFVPVVLLAVPVDVIWTRIMSLLL